MLHLIGADETKSAVTGYGKALTGLYKGNPNGDVRVMGRKLAQKAHAAITALQPFVIRHGIDDLPKEHKTLGEWGFWSAPVPHASNAQIELVLRVDRTLRMLKDHVADRSDRTNDPRFHVGWQHLDEEVDKAERCLTQLPAATRVVTASNVKAMRKLREDVGVHSKMRAVAALVATAMAKREKVLLFCHHHATADQGEWLTEQLRDPELSVAYLNAALSEGDQAAFMLALRNVAKARGGVATMARQTGMNRVALSRALSQSGNPELRSLTRILEASGLQLAVVSRDSARPLPRGHRARKAKVPVVSGIHRGARY